jgi:hypothetical protein
MPAVSKLVLPNNPSPLQWQSPAELPKHFRKHSLDQGNCLKKSLSRGVPFTVGGYLQTQKDIVSGFAFLFRAIIRNRRHPDPKHQTRIWAFGSNMFCVGLSPRTKKVITAFHNHLSFSRHDHSLFETAYPSDARKEDAFLEWLSRGESVAASAKVFLGTNVSHEITDVLRMQGFSDKV